MAVIENDPKKFVVILFCEDSIGTFDDIADAISAAKAQAGEEGQTFHVCEIVALARPTVEVVEVK